MTKLTASEELAYATSPNIVHPRSSNAAVVAAAEVAAAARVADVIPSLSGVNLTGKIKKGS